MDGINHLHADIVEKINQKNRNTPIIIASLKPNTSILVKTQNSLYTIVIIEGNSVLLQGGETWLKPTPVYFNGSTWGGNLLWYGRIGYNMFLEFLTPLGLFMTSPVKNAKITSPDGWFYEMDW